MTTYNQIKSNVWENKQEYPLSTESLRMLFDNRIPLIRLKEFATLQECEMLVAQAQLLNFDCYQDVNPKIERIGITAGRTHLNFRLRIGVIFYDKYSS